MLFLSSFVAEHLRGGTSAADSEDGSHFAKVHHQHSGLSVLELFLRHNMSFNRYEAPKLGAWTLSCVCIDDQRDVVLVLSNLGIHHEAKLVWREQSSAICGFKLVLRVDSSSIPHEANNALHG